jgi:hypothetical protein
MCATLHYWWPLLAGTLPVGIVQVHAVNAEFHERLVVRCFWSKRAGQQYTGRCLSVLEVRVLADATHDVHGR